MAIGLTLRDSSQDPGFWVVEMNEQRKLKVTKAKVPSSETKRQAHRRSLGDGRAEAGGRSEAAAPPLAAREREAWRPHTAVAVLCPSPRRRECCVRLTSPDGAEITFTHRPTLMACDFTRELAIAIHVQNGDPSGGFRIARPDQLGADPFDGAAEHAPSHHVSSMGLRSCFDLAHTPAGWGWTPVRQRSKLKEVQTSALRHVPNVGTKRSLSSRQRLLPGIPGPAVEIQPECDQLHDSHAELAA